MRTSLWVKRCTGDSAGGNGARTGSAALQRLARDGCSVPQLPVLIPRPSFTPSPTSYPEPAGSGGGDRKRRVGFIFSSFAHLVISRCDDQSEQLFGPSLPLPLRGVRMRLVEQQAAGDEMRFWGAGGPTAEGSGHGAGLGLRAPPDRLPVSLPAPGRTPE